MYLEQDYSHLNCLTFLKFEKSMPKANINNYFLKDSSVGHVHTMQLSLIYQMFKKNTKKVREYINLVQTNKYMQLPDLIYLFY